MKRLKDEISPTESRILFYQTEDGRQRIEARLEGETVWLSQKLMADLFQVGVNTINYHVKAIYKERELLPGATIRNYRIVQDEGSRKVSRQVDFYNLEMIIAVGYRVRSHRGTQFRQWATEQLREYIVKGFVIDDERLSEPGGIDYFDELLERIRAIRASEKRFYQKIRDIYSLSADYDPNHPMTQEFFATVQNKLLYAVTGQTAAEIIHSRAGASKNNMGLKTWKGAGRGRILTKTDTTIAKNYLDEEEIKTLELLVNQYLDFAEFQARRRKVMYMSGRAECGYLFIGFEDKLSDSWLKCLEGDNAAFLAVTAFYRIMLQAAEEHGIEVLLIDIGANPGAVNRAALIAVEHIVIPLAPGLYSLQGLKNIGTILNKWRKDWKLRLAQKPK